MSLYSSLTQVLAPFAAKINGLLTGWDGTRYNTPGEAVRQQINDLHVLIGDTPGTAIQASAVAYNGSNVAAELTMVNGRLAQIFNDNALLDGVGTGINWEVGYIDASGVPKPGVPSGGNYYCYTNLIPCEKSVVINATAGYKCRYFIYDKESEAYVSAIGNQNVPYNITLNDTTKSYRVAWLLKSGATQAETQAAAEEIENYITVTAQSEPAITEEKLNAIGIASKSYVDESVGKFVWHSGYVWPDDGVVYPGQQTGGRYHVYSDMVWSEYGLRVEGSRNLRWFRYEKDGTYVTGVNYQTAPVSLDLPGRYAYRIQLLGGTATEAQEIISNIDDYVTIAQKSASDTGWIDFLPITDVYIGDVQQRIYFNELARYNENDGYFTVSASGATYPIVTYTDRYIEFNPTQAVNVTLTISYYYRDTLSATKTLTAHCKTAAFSAKKIMFLGDSYTQNGGMVKWFKDHNTNNVTLYGTRETTLDGVTYQHEGRGGWTASNYLNNASVGAVTNPFYNPTTQTFDFSYYMSNAGSAFTDVEIVNILLGRNSGFPVSNMDNLDLIVASIKAYNPNIMVVLMCDSNLAADNSGGGAYMQSVHTANKQSHIYNKAFYERYKDSTDVVMCFANLNLDNVYDFAFEEVDASIINPTKVKRYTDNVHPWNIPGLGKFGIALNGLLRNVLN